jgi:hypothetical protein
MEDIVEKLHNENEKYKRNCAVEEIKKIIRERKFIKNIDEKHKNNKIVNKLLSKNYHNLTFYNEIYIDSKQEQVSLYDDEIIRYVGLNPENK